MATGPVNFPTVADGSETSTFLLVGLNGLSSAMLWFPLSLVKYPLTAQLAMSRLLALSLGHGPRPLASLRPLISRTCAVRAASTSAATDQDKKKAYSATLLLPKTSLPLRVKNAPKVEARLRDRTTHELYREQVGSALLHHGADQQFKQNEGEVFILHDGPPYANGNLHMGTP